MALQIAQGMQHAVRKISGLVHRDSSRDILVDGRARAMVTDFGLVGAADAEAGTPAYMGPNNGAASRSIRDGSLFLRVHPLRDVHRHRMFAAETVEQWKSAHLTGCRSLRDCCNWICRRDAAIVMKCLPSAQRTPAELDEIVIELASLFIG